MNNLERILEIMADGKPRTSGELAELLGVPEYKRRGIASLVSGMARHKGQLVVSHSLYRGKQNIHVYKLNADYVAPEVKPAKDHGKIERERVAKIKATERKVAEARLVSFRSPNESGPGIPYIPQPAMRAQVRYGGVSSLEGF